MNPLAFPSAKHTVVVIPDLTRPFDSEVWLPTILGSLQSETVEVVVALGLHRPLTPLELGPLRRICDEHGALLRQHDPDDPNLQHISEDPPGWFAPDLIAADLIVCAGVVEPHQ